MKHDATRRGRPTRRLGALLSTELLFVLPLLMLLVLAFLEFSFLISAETRVTLASREGARVAALGGSPDDVLAAVTNVLGPCIAEESTVDITYPNGSQTTGNPVTVTVSVPAKAMVPILVFGRFDPSTLQLQAQTTMTIE